MEGEEVDVVAVCHDVGGLRRRAARGTQDLGGRYMSQPSGALICQVVVVGEVIGVWRCVRG